MPLPYENGTVEYTVIVAVRQTFLVEICTIKQSIVLPLLYSTRIKLFNLPDSVILANNVNLVNRIFKAR